MKRITTEEIREHIRSTLMAEKEKGAIQVVLISKDIHKDLELSNRMPMVCNAMRSLMRAGDIVLHEPLKGEGSTVKIEYRV